MEEELGEKRGDFLMTFTEDEWEFMKSDLQFMFRALVRAGCQMPTVLVVDDDIKFSFQAFRQHLRDADDWNQPGLLILKMYRPEDGSTARSKVELFVPLYPTLEEASQAGLVDATGLLTGHQN